MERWKQIEICQLIIVLKYYNKENLQSLVNLRSLRGARTNKGILEFLKRKLQEAFLYGFFLI